jgi:ATP-dependent DNA helicase RecQ
VIPQLHANSFAGTAPVFAAVHHSLRILDKRTPVRYGGSNGQESGMPVPPPASIPEKLRSLIHLHWGIQSLRPLQEEAMRAVLHGHDSLVVMPTGGGKSLCYQAPPLVRGETSLVVSPLIALMKDQVDGLRASGVPAAQIDSAQSPADRQQAEADLQRGAIRLLFASPERLTLPGFQRLLLQARVRTFAIDEAHCISHWGHDFRQEYRQLNRLKELFPGAAVHAYTATATERVRRDIVAQLNLQKPAVLVGNFDRPYLTYRVVGRDRDLVQQVLAVLGRHKGEAGIIYCIRRRDVDELAGQLRGNGIRALPYHAGMDSEARHAAQEAFAAEECDVIVATVAFGMGIDKSNLRFVLHTAMPKSVEHYQQEAGRAGRDGLEAECVMLFSTADFMTWKRLVERSAAEAIEPVDPSYVPEAMRHLEDMLRYCRTTTCRHRALVEYFGQSFPKENCHGCDRCLEGVRIDSDSVVIAQKILSCVARVNESFGIKHVIEVLRGQNTVKIAKHGHDKLSTFGLLKSESEGQIRDWLDQLLDQRAIWIEHREPFSFLRLNAASWAIMRGQRPVKLVRTGRLDKVKRSRTEAVSWAGVDTGLFETLRVLRRRLADERRVPSYVVFSDATLRELARRKPTTIEQLGQVHGVGEMKSATFGEAFLKCIRTYSRENGIGSTDQ